MEFINPLMLEPSIPKFFRDKFLGIEIKVVESDYPGLVIASQPTYE